MFSSHLTKKMPKCWCILLTYGIIMDRILNSKLINEQILLFTPPTNVSTLQ